MPKHVISKRIEKMETANKRERIDAYYDAAIYVVELLHYWPQDSDELQEFLDYGRCTDKEPPEFEDLKEALATVYYAGRQIGLKEVLSERQIFALARNLCRSRPRQKSYLKTLKARRRCALDTPEIVTFRELEEKYQFHLWLKSELIRTGRKSDVHFDRWKRRHGCVTFYDLITAPGDDEDVAVHSA